MTVDSFVISPAFLTECVQTAFVIKVVHTYVVPRVLYKNDAQKAVWKRREESSIIHSLSHSLVGRGGGLFSHRVHSSFSMSMTHSAAEQAAFFPFPSQQTNGLRLFGTHEAH